MNWIVILLLLATAPIMSAESCDPKGQKVEQVMVEKVAVYDEAGNFIRELAKADITLGADILECKASPAYVKILLADKSSAWVDRLEVKVSGGKAGPQRVCKAAPISRNSGTTTPATSGIDPCSGG